MGVGKNVGDSQNGAEFHANGRSNKKIACHHQEIMLRSIIDKKNIRKQRKPD